MLKDSMGTEILSVNSESLKNGSTDINTLLTDSVWYSIRKIVSSMIVLKNSFITVTDKNLIVLKSFLNKNSDKDITNKVLRDGMSLSESSFGSNATYLSHTTGRTAFLSRENHQNKSSLSCISSPVKIKDKIIGYITLSTRSAEGTELLGIFLESLTLNVENRINFCEMQMKIHDYLKNISKKPNSQINFSYQENRIANYLKTGYSIEKMATDFYVSEATIKTYLKRIYEKCGTNNRIDTAIFLLCSDLIDQV